MDTTKKRDEVAKQSDEVANVSPLLHSPKVARKLLGDISNGHFYNLVNQDELELVKLGSSSKVTDRSIRALIDRGGVKKLNKAKQPDTKQNDKGAA